MLPDRRPQISWSLRRVQSGQFHWGSRDIGAAVSNLGLKPKQHVVCVFFSDLNYYYVLYKICELLGEDKFLPFFPMLKDPVKSIEQDEIWKKICAELQWQFIETI